MEGPPKGKGNREASEGHCSGAGDPGQVEDQESPIHMRNGSL